LNFNIITQILSDQINKVVFLNLKLAIKGFILDRIMPSSFKGAKKFHHLNNSFEKFVAKKSYWKNQSGLLERSNYHISSFIWHKSQWGQLS